jgi:hypothetical protein
MTECNLVNFDVTIQGEQPPYLVHAAYRGHTATGEFGEESTQEIWRGHQRSLEQSAYVPNAAGIVAAGSRLYQALLRGHVRDLWIAARADLEQARVDGLRLRLALHPPTVAALPWESLYDPDRNTPFAAGAGIPLVRVEPLYAYVGPARRLRVTLPAKVLVAVPDDPDNLIDPEREIAGIRQVVQEVGSAYLTVHELRGRFSVVQLRAKLHELRADALHFVGHGTAEGLQFWQRDRPVVAPAASLRAMAARVRSVKFALLNTCLAGRGVRLDSFSSVGAQLLQAGLPAVIAMQLPIRDDAAIDFAHFFYAELLRGDCPGAIDLAVDAARGNLYELNPGDFSYGTPMLWLNAEDGRVLVPNGGSSSVVHETAPAYALPLDLAAEGRWLDTMEAIDLHSLPIEYGFVRHKWQHLLDELRRLLHQMHALADPPAGAVYAAKLVEYRRYKAALLRLQRLLDEATGNR